MLRRNAFFIFIGIILAISIVGCGGSPSHPVISGTLPNGTVGTPYTGTLTVTNGTAPFTWSITGLPATLTFPPAGSGNTVTISGTPLVAATITGTATVTDSKGHSSAAFPFSFTIAPSPTPVISGTLPNGNVDVPYSGTLTVTGGVAPFTWNITGLPATLTFVSSGTTVTISGTPLAAATITGTATVTDSTSTSSAPFPFTFTIGPAPTLAITPTSFNLMVGTAANQTLTVSPATIGPYTWGITSGALPAGLVLSNGTAADNSDKTIVTTTNTVTITGTPTTAGNFPFIIQVTDSAAPPNSAQALYSGFVSNSNAQACPAGSNNAGLPAGTSYAFLLKGFDATDDFPIAIAGSFTADGNGGITAADVDYNGVTLGPQNPGSNMDLPDSSYSFSLENGDTRGCLSLVFNAPAAMNRGNSRKSQTVSVRRTSPAARRANGAKPQGVPAPPPPPIPTRVIFQFALGGKTGGVYTTGNIIEFDNGDGATDSWASGTMHVQTLSPSFTVSSLASNFAFGAAGWDDSVDRAAIAGSFTIAGGTIGPIFADFNDAGALSGELTGGSGVINTITPATGRATANFDIPMPAPGPDLQFDAVIYVINANDFYILSSDAVSASVPLLSGRALNSPGTFAAGALNGFSLIASEGFDANAFTNVVTVGTAQFSSTGNTVSASLTQSDNGTVTTPTFAGTYAVDTTNTSSGRVSFTATGTATPPVIYLTSGGDGIEQIQGFSVGQDTATAPNLPNVVSGVLVAQSAAAPAFTPSSVSGTYAFGDSEDVDGQNGSFSGVATFAAPSSYSAVEDNSFVTITPPFLTLATPVSGAFAIVPAGTGTITVGANISNFVTNGQQIFSITPTANANPDAVLAVYTNIVAP